MKINADLYLLFLVFTLFYHVLRRHKSSTRLIDLILSFCHDSIVVISYACNYITNDYIGFMGLSKLKLQLLVFWPKTSDSRNIVCTLFNR